MPEYPIYFASLYLIILMGMGAFALLSGDRCIHVAMRHIHTLPGRGDPPFRFVHPLFPDFFFFKLSERKVCTRPGSRKARYAHMYVLVAGEQGKRSLPNEENQGVSGKIPGIIRHHHKPRLPGNEGIHGCMPPCFD